MVKWMPALIPALISGENRRSIEQKWPAAMLDSSSIGLPPACVDLPLILVGLPLDFSRSFGWRRSLAVVMASLTDGWGKDDACPVGMARMAGEET